MEPSINPVESLYNQYKDIYHFVEDKGEISYAIELDSSFKKNLVIAGASYMEHLFTEKLVSFLGLEVLNTNILFFIKNTGINRKYHTFFKWEAGSKNVNSFFGLFGDEMKKYMDSKIKYDTNLEKAIVSFQTLGSMRNTLAHQNFASHPINDTLDEVYKKFEEGLYFIERLDKYLKMEL